MMRKTNQRPLVIKFGGAVLSCNNSLSHFFCAIAKVQKSTQKQIVVLHGGGDLVDELMTKLNLETVKKNGLRVTPYEHIPFIAGALAGTANKLLQGQAIAQGVKAVGLSLADGGLCQVTELDPELGAVGKACASDPSLLQAILNTGSLPIISSIGLTQQGQLMNVNADQAALAVAKALNSDLVFLSNVAGVLDQNAKLIPKLSRSDAMSLIAEKIITDGMAIKVKAALDAARELGRPIEIASWQQAENFAKIFANERVGTLFDCE